VATATGGKVPPFPIGQAPQHDILQKLKAARSGGGWIARCPAHEDHTPSLSIHERDGKWLLKCHAGCTTEDICAAVGLKIRDLFSTEPRIKATYDYTDEEGKLLFQTVRYEPGFSGEKKTFRQRRPNGNGWIWGLGETRRVLYRLPEVVAANDVLVCEGEKDCSTALVWGLVATCNPMGAGKWRDEYSESLRGKHVTIIADADKPGREHAQQIAASLAGKAQSVKVLELRAKDLTAWAENGGTRDALLELIRNADATPANADDVHVLTDLAALTVPDMPEAVLDGRLGELSTSGSLAALPRAYSWTALVTCAGAIAPPQEHLRTNLFACLVGATHTGKSVAIDYAAKTLGVPPVIRREVMAGSAETLIANELGQYTGGACLLDTDEMGHLLAKAQIESASFPYVLNSAFYKDRFDVLMAKGKKATVDCRLSVIGGLVEENFGNAFGFQSTLGLLDRFIFGMCPSDQKYLWEPFQGAPPLIIPRAISIDADVWEARNTWLKENPDWNPRVVENALRVAAICASFNQRPTLRAEHLGPAHAFAEYQHRVRMILKPNVGENTDARCAAAIINWLDAHAKDGIWVGQRTLYRAITANRYGPFAFERATKQGKKWIVRRAT
jgi:5S rRNA maturation endonuclease (ribonuclease M5)